MLSDGHPHMFVAGGNLDVTDAASGQECALSDGDALQLQSPPPADATSANLVVMASKGGSECPRASTVSVQVTDYASPDVHVVPEAPQLGEDAIAAVQQQGEARIFTQ